MKIFKLAYTKPAYPTLPFLHFDSETTIKDPSWSSSPPPHLLPPTPHPQALSHDRSLCVPLEVLPGPIFHSCKRLSTFCPVNSVWFYHTLSKIIWFKKLSTFRILPGFTIPSFKILSSKKFMEKASLWFFYTITYNKYTLPPLYFMIMICIQDDAKIYWILKTKDKNNGRYILYSSW